MEIQAKVMDLEDVLNETKKKLSVVEHQKSQLESHLADTQEKLNQEQNLVSDLEEQKIKLSSALDEVNLVSGCESVNSRSDQLIGRAVLFFCAIFYIMIIFAFIFEQKELPFLVYSEILIKNASSETSNFPFFIYPST